MEKKAVVWISTILYTMISLAIIGLLLSVIQPKISQIRDSLVIDQTKTGLAEINKIILDTSTASGMRLPSEFRLGKGLLIISGQNNSIEWTYDTKYKYSEVGRLTRPAGIYELTTEIGKDTYRISLKLNYSDIDLKYKDQETEKIVQPGSIPYKIWFENKNSYINVNVE